VTATIVTVLYTAANMTSIQTLMPTGWLPPPTNAEGTQIQVVTYRSAGGIYTTTIVYPNTFINWPASYEYEAKMYDPASKTSCSPARAMITATIPRPTPQFTTGQDYNFAEGSYGNPKTLTDPKGLLATQVMLFGPGAYPLPSFHFMFPDQPRLNCTAHPEGPAWGGFISAWEFTTSTIYSS